MTARIAAIILAAGRSRRFGAGERFTKVIAHAGGVPMVRTVATTAQASRAASIIVVTGHAHNQVTAALAGIDLTLVHNALFSDGIASSLNVGVAAVAAESDGVLVLLADMPFVKIDSLDRLIAQFTDRTEAVDAVVPFYEGKRGNPCLVGRRLFDGVRGLRGDEGARHLLSRPDLAIDRCEVDDPGVLLDIDTLADLRFYGDR